MQRKPPLPAIILLLLLAVAAGVYYFYFYHPQTASGVLTASGTVETTQVSLAPEISGRISEIGVQEGDLVKAGDVLFRLDDTLLKAQRAIAAASLESASAAENSAKASVAIAQSQYDITLSTAQAKDMVTRSQDWYKTKNSDFTLPQWYFSQTEQFNAAQQVVKETSDLLAKAEEHLAKLESQASATDFLQSESELAAAQANYLVAKNLYDRAWNGTTLEDLSKRQLFLLGRDNYLESKDVETKWVTLNASVSKDLRDEAQQIYDDAKSRLKDAQNAYDDNISTESAKDILKARAQVSMDQENYKTAQDYVRNLQTGEISPLVSAAQKGVEQASAVAVQAATAVKQAQASLDLLDAQLARTVVTAPMDGIVLTRSSEPGSVVNPGGTVLVLGRLDDLSITVYVPEDRMGEVSLGQTAEVSVDSFPGKTFSASVSYISDQAEFTPRNVQTVEGRKNTVFAVKLKLADLSGKLKPGMPADVTFK